jgi:WXG100 family type VII secretion target
MAIISINTDEALAVSQKFQSASEQVTGIINELSAMNQNNLTGWVGESKERYLVQFEEMRPYLNNFVELILGASGQLAKVAAGFGETDTGIASQMGLK